MRHVQDAGPFGPGPFNIFDNPYWPMSKTFVGNRWLLRNTETFSPVVITTQPSPSSFGCANEPVPVYFYKIDPRNYWSAGYRAQLHWMLGVKPNLDVIGFGHYPVTFSNEPDPRSGTSYYRSRDTSPLDHPPYMLIRNATEGSYTVQQAYPDSGTTGDYACYPDDPNAPVGAWSVEWSLVTVAAPGFSGSAVKAAYNEVGGYLENWYFAEDIGPVRIEAIQQGGMPVGITLELIEFQPTQGSARDPHPTFRDLLLARAGQSSGYNFDQWNWFLTAATRIIGPPPEEVCLDASARGNPLSIDEYLQLLENRGQSCSSVQWDFSVLEEMQRRAGRSDGLNFDQWNWYYHEVTGIYGPDPCEVAMPSVTYEDLAARQVMTVSPSRWLQYSAKQWFAMFQNRQPC